MATKTEILLNSVKFNKLTKKQYNEAKAAGQINENEFYITGETLDEGDMLKSEYDSIFAGKELTLTGESIELKDSSEDRISSIMINGYTVQEGTNDASPDNVREIENAGMYNSLNVLNGQESGWSLMGTLNNTYRFDIQAVVPNIKYSSEHKLFAISSFLKPGENNNDSNDYEHFRTGFSEQAKEALVVFINKNKLNDGTVEAAKQYFSEHPLTIAYQSTENTGKFYTGIAVEQGDSYHCEIVKLKDRLHGGDKLDTNIVDKYDTELVITGDESNLSWNATYKTLQIAGILTTTSGEGISESAAGNVYGAVASNYFSGIPANGTELNSTDVIYSQPKYNQLIVGNFKRYNITSLESAKALFKEWNTAGNPLRIFYKSASGGTLKNIEREEHVKKTLVLTGTEDTQDDPGWTSGVIAVLQKLTDAVQVDGYETVANITCSHLKVDTPNDIATNGHVACGQGAGSKLFLYFGSQYNTTELAKAYLAQQYAAGTPVTVEYDLAAPEVFADEPIEIKNPKGTFTISGEKNTSLNVNLKSITDANFLNGRTWNDVEDYIDNKISSSSGSSVTGVKGNAETSYRKGNVNLTPANIGAAPTSHTHTKSQITDFPTSLKNPNALTISLNGTSQGGYDGSAAKSINITPSSIGALPSGGGNFTGWLVGNTDNVGMTWTSADGTIFRIKTYKPSNVCQITRTVSGKAEESVLSIQPTTASFKGNSDTATKVNNNLIIKLNGGTTENTNVFTFNGSIAKTVNITPSAIGAEPTITTKNTAFNKNFGTAAGTVCEGNDARLSNARRASNIDMVLSGTNLWIAFS